MEDSSDHAPLIQQQIEDSSDHAPLIQQQKRTSRGVSVMKDVVSASSKGLKLPVGWNSRGQPVDPNKAKFVSYIGVVARRTVSIRYDNWRNVPDMLKDTIWDDVQSAFDIDSSTKKFVLRESGRLLRTFRTQLSTKWLRDTDGNVNEHPPKKFANIITDEDWRAFVDKHVEENFQKISQENKERAAKTPFPYRKSRMGYSLLEQHLSGSSQSTISRHILWKEARVNKQGVIDNERVQKVWNDCDLLSQSVSQDEVQGHGRSDVLAKALDMAEVPGRVRGAGFGVSQRDYFDHSTRALERDNEILVLRGMVETLTQKLKSMEERMNEVESQKLVDHATPAPIPSAKGSCTQAYVPLPEGIYPAQLALSIPEHRVVGLGEVYNTSGHEMLHNRPIPPNHVKVGIKVVFPGEGATALPVPIDEAVTMAEAIGTCVAWPVNLIILYDLDKEQSKGQSKSGHTRESTTSGGKTPPNQLQLITTNVESEVTGHCKILENYISKMLESGDEIEPINMEKGIFNIERLEFIGMENIKEVLNHEWISASVVSIYVRYLYHTILVPDNKEDSFCFLCPHQIGNSLSSSTDNHSKSRYMADSFNDRAVHGKLFLAPYNSGSHWVLIIIDPVAEIIYYLDSVHGDPNNRPEMKNLFNQALLMYRADRGAPVPKSKSKAKAKSFKWIRVKCPRQANDVDCGYYVLRFMKEVLIHNESTIPVQYFEEFRCSTYSQEILDTVKEEWSQYLVDHCIS